MLRPMRCLAVVGLLVATPVSIAFADSTWPSFRGADRTGVSTEKGLLQNWPAGGPKLLWEAAGAGRGYASVAIADGKVYTLGDGLSTAKDTDEYLTCFDVASGKQLWMSKTGEAWADRKPDWGSSRSTPTVDGKSIYVLTPQGILFCFDDSGKERWKKNLKADFKGQKDDSWGYSESVLIDGPNLICTPGAKPTLWSP